MVVAVVSVERTVAAATARGTGRDCGVSYTAKDGDFMDVVCSNDMQPVCEFDECKSRRVSCQKREKRWGNDVMISKQSSSLSVAEPKCQNFIFTIPDHARASEHMGHPLLPLMLYWYACAHFYPISCYTNMIQMVAW